MSVASVLRSLASARFKLLGYATLKDIPTDRFHTLIEQLLADGWRPTAQYSGFDAWIDYGSLRICKGWTSLRCEWDNWTEGSLEGPRRTVEAIAAANPDCTLSYEWRWSRDERGKRDA